MKKYTLLACFGITQSVLDQAEVIIDFPLNSFDADLNPILSHTDVSMGSIPLIILTSPDYNVNSELVPDPLSIASSLYIDGVRTEISISKYFDQDQCMKLITVYDPVDVNVISRMILACLTKDVYDRYINWISYPVAKNDISNP